jgi:hypothetical protein
VQYKEIAVRAPWQATTPPVTYPQSPLPWWHFSWHDYLAR